LFYEEESNPPRCGGGFNVPPFRFSGKGKCPKPPNPRATCVLSVKLPGRPVFLDGLARTKQTDLPKGHLGPGSNPNIDGCLIPYVTPIFGSDGLVVETDIAFFFSQDLRIRCNTRSLFFFFRMSHLPFFSGSLTSPCAHLFSSLFDVGMDTSNKKDVVKRRRFPPFCRSRFPRNSRLYGSRLVSDQRKRIS